MEDEADSRDRLIRMWSRGHGYAAVFNHDGPEGKRAMEQDVVEQWQQAVAAEYGLISGAAEPNPQDPPDFHVPIGGDRIGVELVQLVEQAHKKRALKGENHRHGQLFMDEWDCARFLTALGALIFGKGEKYLKRGISVDLLLIHTDEPWLSAALAQGWLAEGVVAPHPAIANVHLVFDYVPGWGSGHWPVLPVYGALHRRGTASPG